MKLTKKVISFVIAILLIILSVVSIGEKQEVLAAESTKNVVVVLDPGHGGVDEYGRVQTGTCNAAYGLVERDLNLLLATYTKQELLKYEGVDVYLTRTNNTDFLSLSDRAQFAKEHGADILISQHFDGNTNTSLNGCHIIVSQSKYKTTYNQGSTALGKLIGKNIQSTGIAIRSNFASNGGVWTKDCTNNEIYEFSGESADYYGVINESIRRGFPGIIIEHATTSNSSDAAKVASAGFLQKLAKADANAIAQYYGLTLRNINTQATYIQYKAHVAYIGWQDYKYSDEIAGSVGISRGIESLELDLVNPPEGASINASVYVNDIGWQDTYDFTSAKLGTIGKYKAISGINLTLNNMPGYTIQYRTHVSHIGWTDWVNGGIVSGAPESGEQIEAIQIRLVGDGTITAENTTGVIYQAHVQSKGWLSYVSNGYLAGTEGASLRMEALNIQLANCPEGATISAKAHIQDIGWWDYGTGTALSLGTTGASKRIEAIELTLNGMEGYVLQYRVHVQDIGWTDWCSQGELAGTVGQSKRIEAIQVKIVSGNSVTAVKPSIAYRAHVSDYGWLGWTKEENIAGTEGKSKRLEALYINVTNLPAGVTISGDAHIQNIGWTHYDNINSSTVIGTLGQYKRLEALSFKLNGCDTYKLQYRVHVQNIGWMDWVDEGNIAGTTGKSLRIEAIQMRIVAK